MSADHLDRHPTLDAYAAAKARVFANQTADDWAVVNADSPEAMAVAASQPRAAGALCAGPRSRRRPSVFADRGFIWQRTSDGDVPLVPLSAVQLAGRHS